MYISCPKCSTRFIVSADEVGSSGRSVKCSKCLHVWHYQSDLESEKAAVIDMERMLRELILRDKIALPVLQPVNAKPKKEVNHFLLPFVLLVTIMAMLGLMLPQKVEPEGWFVRNRLAVHDVEVSRKNNGSEDATVTYRLVNNSAHPVKVPRIRVRLFNKDRQMIDSIIVNDDTKSTSVLPKESITVAHELKVPRTTESVDVLTGNKIEMIIADLVYYLLQSK